LVGRLGKNDKGGGWDVGKNGSERDDLESSKTKP